MQKLQIIPNIECPFTMLILEKTRGEKYVIRRLIMREAAILTILYTAITNTSQYREHFHKGEN
jgi:hypothetical protein